jgi:hypothetical protein
MLRRLVSRVRLGPALVLMLAVALAARDAGPVRATTIDPLLWEQLVLGADFVGIIECETSGGIVAPYRVVESWKGPKAGTRFSLRIAVNYWDPQFPIVLCGEKFLVTAFKSHAPANVMSTSSGGGVPLWWRNVPADFSLPLFQGRTLLSADLGESSIAGFGTERMDLREFRRVVAELLSLKPEEQETLLLRKLAEKYIFKRHGKGKDPVSEELAALRKEIAEESSPSAMVAALGRYAGKDAKKRVSLLRHILEQGGGAATLKLIEESTDEPFTLPIFYRHAVTRTIRRRLGLQLPEPARAPRKPAAEEPPTEDKLDEMRRTLRSEKQRYQLCLVPVGALAKP